jgi:hypothetical protein
MPRPGELEDQRGWTLLAEAIAKKIPHPVLLAPLRIKGAPRAPKNAGEANRIAEELHRQLSSPLHRGLEFEAGEHRFILLDHGGDGRWPDEVRGHLQIPRPCAGLVDDSGVPGKIHEKVSDYTEIAEKVPFVVAMSAHPWTGVSFGCLQGLASGSRDLLVNLDVTDYYAALEPYEPPEREPWRLDDRLSGVLWIDNALPFGASWWPNTGARHPLPERIRDSINSR